MSGFSLLDVLKIESIVTDITVSSTGEETTVTGGTTVAGATLLGLPATIDAEGIHVDREAAPSDPAAGALRSEEHTSELQSLMRISYAVFCLKKKNDHLETTAQNTSELQSQINNTDPH